MKRILIFEGAGMPGAEASKNTIGNCRVRTAFHLDDGKEVYLELHGWDWNGPRNKRPACYKWKYTGFIDYLYGVDREGIPESFEYTKENILKLVNSLGASFDEIEVDNEHYRVFADGTGTKYNYGERVTE